MDHPNYKFWLCQEISGQLLVAVRANSEFVRAQLGLKSHSILLWSGLSWQENLFGSISYGLETSVPAHLGE